MACTSASADPSASPRAWPQDALLLVAHGATQHRDAARVVHAHAAALRAQGRFAAVGVGLLTGTPGAAEALAQLTPPVVHAVPFFMEHGWFVREAIPRALAAAPAHRLRYHAPLGTHPRLAALAGERVRRACAAGAAAEPGADRFGVQTHPAGGLPHAAIDPASCAVLLVGHGSARAPGRPMALHRHAERLAAERCFAAVEAAFLEEPPLIPDVLHAWRDRPVAVVGFFAGEGGHVRDDVPALLAAERSRRAGSDAPLLDLGIVADDPAIPDLILDLVAGTDDGA